MAGRGSQDVLGRARRDAARLATERADLLAQRDVIDQKLGLVDARAATVQVVIDYCESGTDDDIDPDGLSDGDEVPAVQETVADGPPWGRQPDRNRAGLTRVQLARRMLEQGSPLTPRAIAEAFHGTDQISRGQIESIRRVLRKLATEGVAQVLPDGTYAAVGDLADQTPSAPPVATEDQRREESSVDRATEAAVTAPAAAFGPQAPARFGTWTPRVIPGLVSEPVTGGDPVGVVADGPRFAVGMNVLLQLLATSGRPMRARELAQALGREPTTSQLESIRQSLRRCVERGQAVLVEPGRWAIAAPLLAGGRAGV